MSEAVKEMLTVDISLKKELDRKFVMIVTALVMLICIILVLFFVGLCYYKKSVKMIESEKAFIQRQRDSLRVNKEDFYKITKKVYPYTKAMYDTIKIKK